MSELLVSERDLTRQVSDLARLFGWRRYHAWLSKHSPAGFPDEVLLRGGRLAVLELKSERGRLTPTQEEWLEAFRRFGGMVNGLVPLGVREPRVDVELVRPSDFDRLAELLR